MNGLRHNLGYIPDSDTATLATRRIVAAHLRKMVVEMMDAVLDIHWHRNHLAIEARGGVEPINTRHDMEEIVKDMATCRGLHDAFHWNVEMLEDLTCIEAPQRSQLNAINDCIEKMLRYGRPLSRGHYDHRMRYPYTRRFRLYEEWMMAILGDLIDMTLLSPEERDEAAAWLEEDRRNFWAQQRVIIARYLQLKNNTDGPALRQLVADYRNLGHKIVKPRELTWGDGQVSTVARDKIVPAIVKIEFPGRLPQPPGMMEWLQSQGVSTKHLHFR